jgi:hypothetical protein
MAIPGHAAGAWSRPPRMFAGFLQPAGLRDRLHVTPNHGDR